MPYPNRLATQFNIDMGDYFLGANTFLLEMYRALDRNQRIDLAVHRGYISEYVYGIFFGRKQYPDKLEWWINQWPGDATVIFLSIEHDQYLKRSGEGPPDTVYFHDEEKWETMMVEYERALTTVTDLKRKAIVVDGAVPFKDQIEHINMRLLHWVLRSEAASTLG
jgi:hypothetical protein